MIGQLLFLYSFLVLGHHADCGDAGCMCLNGRQADASLMHPCYCNIIRHKCIADAKSLLKHTVAYSAYISRHNIYCSSAQEISEALPFCEACSEIL